MRRKASASAARTNNGWVLIVLPGNEIDQVGLEDYGFASDVDREEAKSDNKGAG